MRTSVATCLMVSLLVIPLASAGTTLEVALPFQMEGDTRIEASQFVALVLAPGTTFTMDIATMEASTLTNHTFSNGVKAFVEGAVYHEIPPAGTYKTTEHPGALKLDGNEVRGDGVGILIVRGAAALHSVTGHSAAMAAESVTMQAAIPRVFNEDGYYLPPTEVQGLGIVQQAPTRVLLESAAAEGIVLYGLDVACDQEPCPTGGGRFSTRQAAPRGEVVVSSLFYEELSGDFSVRFEGTVVGWVALGNPSSVEVDGAVRLPLATSGCSDCGGPEDQTVSANGVVRLSDFRVDGGRAHLQIDGKLDGVRFDEQAVESSALLGTTTIVVASAGLVGVGVAIKFLLTALYSRRPTDPLTNKRRAHVYQYVVEHPGSNFRDVVRGAEVASGTARHHLTILKRHGLVVERRHGATLRFFENHGKFDKDWASVVAMREEGQPELAAWLAAHPASEQKQVIEGMAAAHAWSRSTTQHRLSRLVSAGAATMSMHGRRKRYSMRPDARVLPAPGSTLGPAPQAAT